MDRSGAAGPILVWGRGSVVRDVNGKEYLDFNSGQMCAALGHNHPRIVQALRESGESLIHSHMRPVQRPGNRPGRPPGRDNAAGSDPEPVPDLRQRFQRGGHGDSQALYRRLRKSPARWWASTARARRRGPSPSPAGGRAMAPTLPATTPSWRPTATAAPSAATRAAATIPAWTPVSTCWTLNRRAGWPRSSPNRCSAPGGSSTCPRAGSGSCRNAATGAGRC